MTWMERNQIALALSALLAGLAVGVWAPGAKALEVATTPAVALLLFATFLAVPLVKIGHALRNTRFLVMLLLLNFVVVPVVVFALSRFVAHDMPLLVGVLLVLLTPCIDYVIVFSRLAGAAHENLLAAAPLLLIAQLLLLPVYLVLFVGPSSIGIIEVAPFAQAFLFLILLPLLVAGLVQGAIPRSRAARAVSATGALVMVPLLALVLFTIMASHAQLVLQNLASLTVVMAIFAAFLVIMAPLGMLAARVSRLPTREARALTFSGATRNSLVVLPLALALPVGLNLAPAVIVTQTLVELLGMLVYTRIIPRLIR